MIESVCLCVICKNYFPAKRSDAKYCSEKCRTRKETMDRTKKKQESLKTEIIPVECLTCKVLFTPSKYRKDQIYCGPKCLNKGMGIRQSQKEGYAQQKSEYDREYRKNNANKKSEINRKYKDRIRFSGNKENVLERDGHKCVECGENDPKRLIIHHKDHSGSTDNPNNDMSNLETLCRICHMKYHTTEENHVLKKRIDNETVKRAVESSSTYTEAAEKLGVSRTWVARTSKKFNFSRTVK